MITVKRLLRKHEAFERDLDAIGERMKELDNKYESLVQNHPSKLVNFMMLK